LELNYRILRKNEINKVKEIDRRDFSEEICKIRDGKIEIVKEIFEHKGFSSEQFDQIIKSLENLYDNGGTIFGAFDNSTLVGISALENKFRGRNQDTVKLDVLWISQPFRKQGVGKKLVEMVKEKAKQRGARKLYISSCESKNTVDFYVRIGAVITSEIDQELFELEPYDIHLVLKI
jgi:predicted N-acetyltransferase YhbS